MGHKRKGTMMNDATEHAVASLADSMRDISATLNDLRMTVLGREDCLRDKFAMAALPEVIRELEDLTLLGLAQFLDEPIEKLQKQQAGKLDLKYWDRAAAQRAYQVADAMLWARGQGMCNNPTEGGSETIEKSGSSK